MRYISKDAMEESTWQLLATTESARLPVPIELVADRIGLRVEAAPLGSGVSGLLVIEGDRGTIGYNEEHPYVRQRFSIAHELAHWVLHRNDPDSPDLFIDSTRYVSVYLRDEQSSTGEKKREVQANMFAAALLMPERLLRREISGPDFDSLDEEEMCAELATRFQVSHQAMSLRLATLGILLPAESE